MEVCLYDNERDKELLQAPYKKLKKAEDLVNSNALLDEYVRLYKERYKGLPVFPASNTHLNMIKSFASAAGHKAYALLETFFEMSDPWYVQHGHSIDCLLNNISKVNAVFSQKTATKKLAGNINLHTFCDCCHKFMIAVVKANHNYDTPNKCEECEKSNAPLKRVTKEEIKKTAGTMFNVALEIPKENPANNGKVDSGASG